MIEFSEDVISNSPVHGTISVFDWLMGKSPVHGTICVFDWLDEKSACEALFENDVELRETGPQHKLHLFGCKMTSTASH